MTNNRSTVRRKALDPILFYDIKTNLPIGQVMNMSEHGVRLMTEHPVQVYKVLYCRIPLPDEILGCSEIVIDAECRWCKKNEKTGWYDSGYKLRKVTQKDADVIKLLTRRWMINQSEELNASGGRQKKKKRHFSFRLTR